MGQLWNALSFLSGPDRQKCSEQLSCLAVPYCCSSDMCGDTKALLSDASRSSGTNWAAPPETCSQLKCFHSVLPSIHFVNQIKLNYVIIQWCWAVEQWSWHSGVTVTQRIGMVVILQRSHPTQFFFFSDSLWQSLISPCQWFPPLMPYMIHLHTNYQIYQSIPASDIMFTRIS